VARTYFIETFGCQMNVHDSERIAGLLEQAGYAPALDDSDADLVVLNTCSVRERAEDKLYSRLGELAARRTRPGDGAGSVIAVTGCVAQQEGERLMGRSRAVDLVVGTQALKQLPVLVGRVIEGRSREIDVNPYEDVSFPLGLARRGDPVKAYVTIIEGCNDFCSFCVVPYTRGRERMRPVSEILAEVREAADSGRREIHLLGQIVNHYSAPDRAGCDFARLLELVHEVPAVERIRFASPHPRHVTAAFIDAMTRLPKVCRHLHLPVQSGSTRVLSAMRRRYTRAAYIGLVERLREAMPDLALSTDMIVGFPGETVDDFAETLSLTETVRFHSMFSFKYSSRPHTLADKRMPDDVSDEEKTRRIVALQQLQRSIQLELHEALVGRSVEVLIDGRSRKRASELSGRTPGNTVVNLEGPPEWLGRLVRVTIQRAGPNSLWGAGSAPLDTPAVPA
jgi:tRNA-2-methylthio-N6-dimethylallyladenosine synthase